MTNALATTVQPRRAERLIACAASASDSPDITVIPRHRLKPPCGQYLPLTLPQLSPQLFSIRERCVCRNLAGLSASVTQGY
jgi:hypothetical protein